MYTRRVYDGLFYAQAVGVGNTERTVGIRADCGASKHSPLILLSIRPCVQRGKGRKQEHSYTYVASCA